MKANQAWQAVLGQLQMEMPKATYDTWVAGTKFVGFDTKTNIFSVGLPNAYARDWLESRLTSTIARLLTGMMDLSVEVEFVIHQSVSVQDPEEDDPDFEEDLRETIAPNITLNPKYSFENFTPTAGNRLAHAACLAVAEKLGTYNPLFIFSDPGLGKTHLLHALGNMVESINVLYATSEEFVNDFVAATRTNGMEAFRNKYRNVDVLLFDDVHFLQGKDGSTEEFLSTFKALNNKGAQIVITSNLKPKNLAKFEEALRSRLEWGLVTDIQFPRKEEREAILLNKAAELNFSLPIEIIERIAFLMRTHIRGMEGALTRVRAHMDLRGIEPTPELIGIWIADLIPDEEAAPDKIVEMVVEVIATCTVEEIFTRDRTQRISLPRQAIMYLLRNHTHMALPVIGQFLGGRDHTTVMYGIDRISDVLNNQPESVLAIQIQKVESKIKAVPLAA